MRVTLLFSLLVAAVAAEDTKVIKLGKENWDDALGMVRTRYFLKLYEAILLELDGVLVEELGDDLNVTASQERSRRR